MSGREKASWTAQEPSEPSQLGEAGHSRFLGKRARTQSHAHGCGWRGSVAAQARLLAVAAAPAGRLLLRVSGIRLKWTLGIPSKGLLRRCGRWLPAWARVGSLLLTCLLSRLGAESEALLPSCSVPASCAGTRPSFCRKPARCLNSHLCFLWL